MSIDEETMTAKIKNKKFKGNQLAKNLPVKHKILEIEIIFFYFTGLWFKYKLSDWATLGSTIPEI